MEKRNSATTHGSRQERDNAEKGLLLSRQSEILEGHHNGISGRLVIPTTEGLLYLPFLRLVQLDAEGSYTRIHAEGGRALLVSQGLGMLHRLLPKDYFFRCHDRHVVNLLRVACLLRSGGYRAELLGGTLVSIARRRWHGMKEAMKRLNDPAPQRIRGPGA